MRTIRALAAAAALASLLAASGPAAAKIMQLTLGGHTNGILFDGNNYTGACGEAPFCSMPEALKIDFIFTYDTNVAQGLGAALLSARMEIRVPDYQETVFTPDGDLYGAFNMPLGPNASMNGLSNTYEVYSSLQSGPGSDDVFDIHFPENGTGVIDQEMTYYPDPTTSYNPGQPGYGNSDYDLYFIKGTTHDANSVLIYDIHTLTDSSGAISTRYVSFKDITPGGVPEPAAWALMLLGFGGLGAALRRRRAAWVAV